MSRSVPGITHPVNRGSEQNSTEFICTGHNLYYLHLLCSGLNPYNAVIVAPGSAVTKPDERSK